MVAASPGDLPGEAPYDPVARQTGTVSFTSSPWTLSSSA